MAEPTWVIEYQPVPDEAAIRADERRKVAEEIAQLADSSAAKCYVDFLGDGQRSAYQHIAQAAREIGGTS